jgi:hypothetical protein
MLKAHVPLLGNPVERSSSAGAGVRRGTGRRFRPLGDGSPGGQRREGGKHAQPRDPEPGVLLRRWGNRMHEGVLLTMSGTGRRHSSDHECAVPRTACFRCAAASMERMKKG